MSQFELLFGWICDRFLIRILQLIVMKIVLIALLVISALASVKPDPAHVDQILAVYNKTWYSGYLDVDNNSTHMHYFYFPSQNSPQNDPVLFWFNGGPGCSSLLGALMEHGPFVLNDVFASLINNQWSWNMKANVIYIESPAQVGFSYMDGKPPTWTDDLVAKLNAKAIRQFFQVWPEYQGRDTYISGESYGGIYVPTVFYELHTTGQTDPLKFTLKGFAVGNGCTDPLECEFQNDYGVYQMMLYRDLGFITQEQYDTVDSKCKDQGAELPDDCQQLLDQVDQLLDGINIYDVFKPCYENSNIDGKKLSMSELRRIALRIKRKPSDKLTWAPPCVDSYGADKILLNRENRKGMGIPEKVIDFSMCNNDQDFQYERSSTGSYWVYQKLIPLNKYKIVIYSGDADPAVPYSGTLAWINKIRKELSLPTEQYWRTWYTTTTNGRQNSGKVWTLSNSLKLVTFKGVGHMAPQFNYEGGYRLINNLIHGQPL